VHRTACPVTITVGFSQHRLSDSLISAYISRANVWCAQAMAIQQLHVLAQGVIAEKKLQARVGRKIITEKFFNPLA